MTSVSHFENQQFPQKRKVTFLSILIKTLELKNANLRFSFFLNNSRQSWICGMCPHPYYGTYQNVIKHNTRQLFDIKAYYGQMQF